MGATLDEKRYYTSKQGKPLDKQSKVGRAFFFRDTHIADGCEIRLVGGADGSRVHFLYEDLAERGIVSTGHFIEERHISGAVNYVVPLPLVDEAMQVWEFAGFEAAVETLLLSYASDLLHAHETSCAICTAQVEKVSA